MKKFFILSTFLGFALSNAQMLIKKHDGTVINDGAVFSFNTFDDDASKMYYRVINSSTTEDIKVKMICESLENSDGDSFQFCFGGYCMPFVMLNFNYPPEGYVIAPGSNSGDNDFLWNQKDYDAPMSASFKFYQVDAFDNEIGTPIRVKYIYDKNLAVTDVNAVKDVLVKNTVVTNSLELNSKINTSFQLFDMNSKLVLNSDIKVGDNKVNVQNLATGVYILNIKNANGKNQTQKIMKK
ncbi:T9SS type A sorting domain-containing protein [Chryseobacterium sp. POL2]|uniref:T9SS type A sorting domain-containing protein n=1 Tax=Chryseobacterium sp. POL2 TaxID=2713414 RepID=UPI0013E10581|nr:T9SS type A sorting domain-containing protein [Chryseobacterium sp. POL2]QIG88831.1 T9SS type A sorting domain-containing protein [Chryseobacterium sp. POL2]